MPALVRVVALLVALASASAATAAATSAATAAARPIATSAARSRTAGSEARSANGRFRAVLESGDLVVAEVRPGEAARKQWSGRHACEGEAAHFLTDDGAVFVHVGSAAAKTPLVETIRRGLRSAAFDARDLEVESTSAHATWIDLARGEAALRLRRETTAQGTLDALDLLGRDGRVRTIELAHGALAMSPRRSTTKGTGAGAPATEPRDAEDEMDSERPQTIEDGVRVEPAAAPDDPRAEPVYVSTAAVAPLHREGEPVAVEVQVDFPTPDWKLAGFELERDPATGDLVLRPRGVPGRGVSAQVLRPLRAIARIGGLAPGRYRGRVDGRTGSPALAVGSRAGLFEFEVVARDLVVSLRATGGIANITRVLRLFADGRFESIGPMEAAPRVVLVPVASWRALEHAVASLPEAPEKSPPSAGADFLQLEIVWPTPAGPRRVIRDDGTLADPFRAIVSALGELATPREEAPAPPRYRFDATTSTLSIRTTSGGLLGAFGHDHTIAARAFSGSIEVERDRLDGARLELSIDATSLAVVDEESRADAAAIEKEMRTAVLETARYPEIVFESTRAVVTPLGERTWKVALTGDLTLHGRTRAVTIPANLSFEDDVVHAIGTLKLRQTDWNIRPSTAAGGTVKVADEVELSFDVVARR